MDFSKQEFHPSFGLLSFSRVSSTPPANLFGSSFRHSHFIMMELKRATVFRDLSNTSYFQNGKICRLAMSPAQFADLITGLNHGGGVPVTLEWLDGKQIPAPPSVNERATIVAEFKGHMATMASEIDDLIAKAREMEEKPTVNKRDREEFRKIAETIRARISSGLPFIHGQFNEAMDKTVSEVKAEMESGVSSVLKDMGLEKMREIIGDRTIESAKAIEA